MGRVPSPGDQVAITRRHAEQIRQLRLRSRGRNVEKTFQRGPAISTDTYIPPISLAVNTDDAAPEVKQITQFRGVLFAGTCTLEWQLNGTAIATQSITTVPSAGDLLLVTPVDIADSDLLQPVVTIASGAAQHLSATVILIAIAT